MSVNNSNSEETARPSSGRLSRLSKGPLRRFFFLIIFLSFFIFFSKGQVVDKIRYYDVVGNNTSEFQNSWNNWQEELGYSGRTEYNYKKTFSIVRNFNGSFSVSNFNLKMNVTMILPRVHYPSSMSRQQRAIYDNVCRKIYAHEMRHRQYKLEFSRSYNASVRNLHSYNPSYLRSAIGRIQQNLDSQMRQKDKTLDIGGHL